MGRTLDALVAAEKDLKFSRPFLSAVFHFGGSVGDIFVADNDITINGAVHKGIVTRWAEFRSVIRPRDGSFQLGKMSADLINVPVFGAPAKRFSDLFTGLAPEAVEVDVYQNFLKIDDPSTVIQDKLHKFVMRPVDHTPERAKIDLISASEKYVDKKEISFPLSEVALPLIKRDEIGKTANLIYGRPKFVRAHQVKGYPTSPLSCAMDSAQTYIPGYADFISLLDTSGTTQVGSEKITYTGKGTRPMTTRNLDTAGSATDANSYSAAVLTPLGNRLVLAWIGNSKATTPEVPTLTGCGLTWVQVATVVFSSSGRRLTLFRAMGPTPGVGPVAIDFAGVTQTSCDWSFIEYNGVDQSGANGSGALVQSATNSAAAVTSLTVTLAAFGSSSNGTAAGFVITANSAITPEAGFTETGESPGHDTPNTRIESEFKSTEDTTPSATFASSDAGGIAVEIKLNTDLVLTGATRGADKTTADFHSVGDTVAFFPTELVYLAASHALKSIPAVYVDVGGKTVPVHPSRYTVELANTTLVSGKTLALIKFTVPPLLSETLYEQTATGGNITLVVNDDTQSRLITFGTQDKTLASGQFKFKIPWLLLTAGETSLELVVAATLDLSMYTRSTSNVLVINWSPYELVQPAWLTSFNIILRKLGGFLAVAQQQVTIEDVTVQYLAPSTLSDLLPNLSQAREIVHKQDATGNEVAVAIGGTSGTINIAFGAQELPKSSGKFRYKVRSSGGGDDVSVKIRLVRGGAEADLVLFDSDGQSSHLVDHVGAEAFEFEDDHWHNSTDTLSFKIVMSKKVGTFTLATYLSVALVTVEYNVLDPSASVQTDSLLPTTTADLIVGGEVLFDCEGYADDGSGTYTGTASALIEQAPDVVHHLLRVPGGVPSAYVDAASFATARDDLASFYKLSGVVTERTNILKEALLALCGQSSLKLDFPVDKFTARALLAVYPAATKTISEQRIVAGSLRVFAGPVSDVINSGSVRYGRDWSVGRSEHAYTGVLAFSDSASITKYGERKQDGRFQFDFIDGDNTALAQDQADFWKARLKEPPRMVALGAYLDEYEILPGDVRAINYLMPDGVERYDGLDGTQKFLAEEVAHAMGAPARGGMRLMNLIFRQVT